MALDITIWFEPRSSTFSYLIDDGQGACAVIDPVLGYDPVSGRINAACLEPLAQALRERDVRLLWLLETHIHADHLSGAQVLKSEFGGQVAAGRGVQDVLASFARAFGWQESQPSSFDRLFIDGEIFRIGALQARVLHVPGHAPADAAYLIGDPAGGPSALFVGDTLFAPDLGTARCDFPGGDAYIAVPIDPPAARAVRRHPHVPMPRLPFLHARAAPRLYGGRATRQQHPRARRRLCRTVRRTPPPP